MSSEGVASLGRVRLPAVLVAVLALLAAGCASSKKADPTTTEAPPAALKPPPKPKPPPPPPKRSKVHVIVFDGDTGAPVRNAVVHVGRFGGKTTYHGVAKTDIARHARLEVDAAKRGD